MTDHGNRLAGKAGQTAPECGVIFEATVAMQLERQIKDQRQIIRDDRAVFLTDDIQPG